SRTACRPCARWTRCASWWMARSPRAAPSTSWSPRSRTSRRRPSSRGSWTSAMPDGDVAVAVHGERRAFVRAVRSALADGDPRMSRAGRVTGAARAGGSSRVEVRVSVVAHNLEADVVRARLEAEGLGGALADGRVRVLELADGVPSPSGPFTLGLEQAGARYVSIMGSDDHLEPGALTAWFALGEARSSAAVLAPMRLDSGRLVRSPVPRPFAG